MKIFEKIFNFLSAPFFWYLYPTLMEFDKETESQYQRRMRIVDQITYILIFASFILGLLQGLQFINLTFTFSKEAGVVFQLTVLGIWWVGAALISYDDWLTKCIWITDAAIILAFLYWLQVGL